MSTSICAIYFNINIDSKAKLVRFDPHKGLNYLLVKLCNKQATSAGDASQGSTTEISGAIRITQKMTQTKDLKRTVEQKLVKTVIFSFSSQKFLDQLLLP